MATIGDAMVTLLTDNWAGAGAAPTFGHLVDYQKDLAVTDEQVIVRLPIHEDVTPINDTYSNFKYTIQIRVKSTVSDDRLKVLADETIRIINTYAITGITRQFAKRGENTSDRKRQVFSYDVWAILEEHMSTGGTSYSSPGAGDVTFPADVTVTGDFGFDTGETVDVILDEDNMASDDEDALATQQSIKKYVDDAAGYSDADAIAAIVAEDPLALTGALNCPKELDMTGAAAIIDLNPSDATGKTIIDITPSAAISSGAWRGIKMNGASLDPSAGGCTIKGIDMDFIGVDLSNNPGLEGVYCRLPATYGGGAEYAGYFTGDGKTVKICSDTYALEVTGNVFQTQGLWYSTNNVAQAYYALYNNLNNGNPFFTIGSSGTNRINIQTYFNAGTQVLDYVKINTRTTSAAGADGNIRFMPDDVEVVRFNTAADTNQVKITGNLEVSGNITDTTDTMTVANLADLLMFGSANAAWVPCSYLNVNVPGKVMAWSGFISNVDGTDFYVHFTLPLPTAKGALKLYVTGLRIIVNDADAVGPDQVSTVYINGQEETGQTNLLTDGTNRSAQGDYEYALADTDCSGYDYVNVTVHCEVTNANDLEFGNPLLSCYYAA